VNRSRRRFERVRDRLYDGTARNTGLRGDHAMFANGHVVCDLDEIVDLGAFADAGFAKSTAIYARIGADLHIVFDHDGSDLRKLDVSISVACKSKPVSADNDAAVENDVVADGAIVFDEDSGIQSAACPDLYVVADVCTGTDLAPVTDRRSVADRYQSTDVHTFTDDRRS